MHFTVENLNNIKNQIKQKLNQNSQNIPKIIAVSKTFPIEKILPLIEFGHVDFGENKVQEAVDKWTSVKSQNKNIVLHLIGKLQTNKVKSAVKIFDYIHSVDSEKLAKKIAIECGKINKKIRIFIQINIGKEEQKSGIDIENLENFYEFCNNLNLEVVGLMCIPPENKDPSYYFSKMEFLKKKFSIDNLSMGMSSDYLISLNFSSNYLRIGSAIFGKRD